LILGLERHLNLQKVNRGFVGPDETLDLKAEHCLNGQGAQYELVGVSKHRGAHYVTEVKRGEEWYHCDDMKGVSLTSEEEIGEVCSNGYVFLYRKK
jgi:ubiquitin C-terminal hydrolase